MDEPLHDLLGARAFAAARALVGTRFRLQGSNPATGLDCVGLVWAAYAAAGVRLVRPGDYPLRGWARERVEAGLVAAGFVPVADRRVGDVALIAFAAGQFHVGLIGPASLVHAHAGLRRVVEAPLDDAVRDAERWRLGGGKLPSPILPGTGRGTSEAGGGAQAVCLAGEATRHRFAAGNERLVGLALRKPHVPLVSVQGRLSMS